MNIRGAGTELVKWWVSLWNDLARLYKDEGNYEYLQLFSVGLITFPRDESSNPPLEEVMLGFQRSCC